MPPALTIRICTVLRPPPRLIGGPHHFAWELRQGERVLAGGTAETATEAHRAAREAAGKHRAETPPPPTQGA